MAYTFKKFVLEKPTLAFRFLMDTFNISMGEAQKMIDKRRVFVEDEQLLKKSAQIVGNISVVVFEGSPKGLEPIFETEDFAVFEKPSGVMMHPRKRSDGYTLNDEIKSLYGKDANAAHRIDKSTSGLVLVGKHKQAEIELKKIEQIYGGLKNRKSKIVKELKIDKYHQGLFDALCWNSFIIDYKKKVFTLSHFYINFSLMKKIAKYKVDDFRRSKGLTNLKKKNQKLPS